jgi:ATP-binding cassette subfamily A (ABC1) protein 3
VSFLGVEYTNSILSAVKYVIHSNYTAVHATPLFSALTAAGIINHIDPTTSLKVNIFPLPLTSREDSLVSSYNVDLVATFLLLAIPYIPASFATYVVREREVKAKHQQMVSGVSIIAYWLSTWIW